MTPKCIDPPVGKRLSGLKYSFLKSSADQQAVYKKHLQECSFCRKTASKTKMRIRVTGMINIVAGFGLMILGLFFPLPIPAAGILCILGGIVWIGIGVRRILSGRD